MEKGSSYILIVKKKVSSNKKINRTLYIIFHLSKQLRSIYYVRATFVFYSYNIGLHNKIHVHQ